MASIFNSLHLEKYLRITEKDISVLDMNTGRQDSELDRQFINNRDEKLKGVVNISKFKEFLQNNEDSISPFANISDYFGDAKLIEGGYEGSIGIKFGIRLCYAPPKMLNQVGWNSVTNDVEFIKQQGRESFANLAIAKREKSFIFGSEGIEPEPSVGEFTGVRFAFPLCSYEKDVFDNRLITYLDSDENFNQDIKCYFDAMTETDEYKLLFDNILNIKKLPSLMALYSYENFLLSLGLGSGERDDGGDEQINPTDLSRIFNDSKAECRKLFVSNYKRKDFDPINEEDEYDEVKGATRRLLAETTSFLLWGDGVPWWLKSRRRQKKPEARDGSECKNQFGGIIKINIGQGDQ